MIENLNCRPAFQSEINNQQSFVMSTSKQSRAVVLLSGGMDSCVCAALAARDHEAAAVHVSYGQRTEERERQSFLAICQRLQIRDKLTVRNEALRAIGGSALTDDAIDVPTSEEVGRTIPVTYVPFRNAHFLAVAVSWAEVLGAEKVFIGAVEPDSSGYPDCRPAYYRAFNEVAKTGTKEGVIEIVTPLIAMRKTDIVLRFNLVMLQSRGSRLRDLRQLRVAPPRLRGGRSARSNSVRDTIGIPCE